MYRNVADAADAADAADVEHRSCVPDGHLKSVCELTVHMGPLIHQSPSVSA